MERIYILDELDCANCAMKIERHVGKIKGVKECSVDFVSKRLKLCSKKRCRRLNRM